MSNIVQILGPSRTGTTITHLMLANAKDAFACGEVYAFFRPWRNDHFKPSCSCGRGFGPCIWRKFDSIEPSFFFEALSKETNTQWIIDESKRLSWVVDAQDWARQNEMNIYNILMFKEPVNLMYSRWKRKRNLSEVRDAYIKYYGRFLKMDIPFLSVNLERLVENPKEKLKQICNAIGMEYFEGKERFWEKQHCHLFGSLGLRKQIEKGNMEIRPEPIHSEEFLREAENELTKINNDERIQHIIDALASREVSKINSFDGIPVPLSNVVKPAWYYKDVIVSAFRKYYPQKWEHWK